MYNKLFTKILDSSIWLQSDSTRIVWITMLAAMDEDGFVQIATVGNLAARARVTLEACREAVSVLEEPELESAHEGDDGRRVEKVPGGWMVIKAKEYQGFATREHQRNKTRERVRRFRERNVKALQKPECNAPVTPSDTDTHNTHTQSSGSSNPAVETKGSGSSNSARLASSDAEKPDPLEAIYQAYPRKVGKRKAIEAIERAVKRLTSKEEKRFDNAHDAQRWLWKVTAQFAQTPAGQRGNLTPHPNTWFNQSRYLDDPAEWQRTEESNGKRSVIAGNVAAARRVQESLRNGDCNPEGPAGVVPALGAGTSGAGAAGVPEAPARPDPGADSAGVRPGSEGVRVLAGAGSAAAAGGRRNREWLF